MKTLRIKNGWNLMTLLIPFLLIFSCPGALKGAEVPSVEDVIDGKAQLPTIADLTGGKVKEGDLVNKDNVDLVKEYLSAGTFELINQGLVMVMRPQLSPDKLVPEFFRDITKRNNGKAIMNDTGAVYYEKMGTPWPGGIPFVKPKNGLEVMANANYGNVVDGFTHDPGIMCYVNPKGVLYKSVSIKHLYVYANCRKLFSPLGIAPGYEKVLYKRLSFLTDPIQVKGLGQYTVRHYDDAKNYDAGFAYLPAFKRTIRASATTWQDNIAGSDLTYGDGAVLQEPYSNWEFRLIGLRYKLLPEPDPPYHYLADDGKLSERMLFDVGKRFPRIGWSVWPVCEVEALPKIKHIYSKKIIHASAWPFLPSTMLLHSADIYDRQMKLWKYCTNLRDQAMFKGVNYTILSGYIIWDIQTGHSSPMYWQEKPSAVHPDKVNLSVLLRQGR